MDARAFAQLYPHEAYERANANGVRFDGRPFARARAVACARTKEEDEKMGDVSGGAVAKRGHTTAIARAIVKAIEIHDERDDQGRVRCDITRANTCDEERIFGKMKEDDARMRECASVVERCVDLESLCVERGVSGWEVKVDVVILDDDGAASDCALVAAVGALMDCELPRTPNERGEGEREGVRRVVMKHIPVCLTSALYRGHVLVDPTAEEEALSRCLVSVIVDEFGSLHGVFKHGGEVEATEDTLMKCIAAAKLHYAATKKVIDDAAGGTLDDE